MQMQMQSVPLRSLQSILLSDPKDALEGWNYKVIQGIGRGGFGQVYKCRNLLTDDIVAIKIIAIPENDRQDGVPGSIIREASILKELDHANIVRLLDVLNNENNVFLVLEYLDVNLRRFINGRSGLDPRLVKYLLQQILSGVAYCHAHKILHRDLKPLNVLVDLSTHTVKLADFGVARAFGVPPSSFTNEVVTLRYRAPELLLGSTEYSTPIDIWSVGCIFAEMVEAKPLFTGIYNWEILLDIFRLLGTPAEETWPGVTSRCEFLESLLDFGYTNGPKDLAPKFPDLEPAGVDLLSKMLCQNPNNRISAEDALTHRYFDNV